jgi:oligopeptidase A
MNPAILEISERENLVVVSRHLQAMMIRLRQIIAQEQLTDDTLVEIMTIFNNVSYIFLYFEANEEYVDYSEIKVWFNAFYRDRELDKRILTKLYELRCADGGVERSRLSYINQLNERLQQVDIVQHDEVKQLQQELKDGLHRVERDQHEMLSRLKLTASSREVASAFYVLQSRAANPDSRDRLEAAWQQIKENHSPNLTRLVDAMVEQRQLAAHRTGFENVLARTLERCRVNAADIEPFMATYLDYAIAAHRHLLSEIGEGLRLPNVGTAHFGHYLRCRFNTGDLPDFYLDHCLDYLLSVATAVFGLAFSTARSATTSVLSLDAFRGDEMIGRINLDLWDNAGKAGGANHTKAIRNRTEWGAFRQLPVAYVSCRFTRKADGKRLISFQNVHSLFHEFGHAINHLLIKGQIPNQSGLEYLPLERLEYLSLWFEKWIYHRDFLADICRDTDVAARIETCRQIKRLEYKRTLLERAVTAYLDFNLHRNGGGGLEACFAELDDKFGVREFCRLSDFVGYFGRPMFIANPGANFIYLWGEAGSCELFAPFAASSLAQIAARGTAGDPFAACFAFELPSATPDPASLFRFYGCAH